MKKSSQKKKPIKQAPSLLRVLLFDVVIRHWLVSALAVSFIIFSMVLANTSHKTRRLTAEWQKLRQEHQDQQILWESLRLELTTLTEPDRISNLARKELGMVEVTTKNEKVISL
ncbi:cell division protein FtsL [Aliikangiella sp. IMCC44359]|uniref:cell division protein FtsL n=1 Tax=Aliikangiella sp. IMCC44359 TaxID=3459125 RepID=UPI00403B0EE7